MKGSCVKSIDKHYPDGCYENIEILTQSKKVRTLTPCDSSRFAVSHHLKFWITIWNFDFATLEALVSIFDPNDFIGGGGNYFVWNVVITNCAFECTKIYGKCSKI